MACLEGGGGLAEAVGQGIASVESEREDPGAERVGFLMLRGVVVDHGGEAV